MSVDFETNLEIDAVDESYLGRLLYVKVCILQKLSKYLNI